MPTDPTIRLLLADVDGTLVTKEKILTEKAIQAVHALRKAGIIFAITSGRPPRGMSMLVAPLGLDTPIAGFNGGVFVKPDMTVIDTHTLAPDVARKAVQFIQGQGLDAWVYTADDWFILNADAPHVQREAWTVKFEASVVSAFSDKILDSAVKIVGVSDDTDKVAACEHALSQELGKHASAARSQPYYLDVTHPDANKGGVVDKLSAMLGIPAAQIATIGDMPNDELMFRRSGFSIAMGNASDQVKASAVATTDDYESEGFANAVNRLVLPRGAPKKAAS